MIRKASRLKTAAKIKTTVRAWNSSTVVAPYHSPPVIAITMLGTCHMSWFKDLRC